MLGTIKTPDWWIRYRERARADRAERIELKNRIKENQAPSIMLRIAVWLLPVVLGSAAYVMKQSPDTTVAESGYIAAAAGVGMSIESIVDFLQALAERQFILKNLKGIILATLFSMFQMAGIIMSCYELWAIVFPYWIIALMMLTYGCAIGWFGLGPFNLDLFKRKSKEKRKKNKHKKKK